MKLGPFAIVREDDVAEIERERGAPVFFVLVRDIVATIAAAALIVWLLW